MGQFAAFCCCVTPRSPGPRSWPLPGGRASKLIHTYTKTASFDDIGDAEYDASSTIVVPDAAGCVMTAMAKSLQSNCYLSTLKMSGCHLGHAGASALSAELNGNSVLSHLNVSKNQMGDRGAACMANLLGSLHLTALDLSHNQIKVAGAIALARSIVRCTVWHSRNIP